MSKATEHNIRIATAFTAFTALGAIIGCSDSPTAPTRITTTAAALKLQAPTRNAGELGPALGTGSATNHEDVPGWFTLVAFDFADGVNQIDVGNLSRDAAPGVTVDLSIGVAQDDCKTYQVDVYWMLPRAAHYTISDTRNYPPIVSRKVLPLAHCRNAPPPPSCSIDAFESFEGHVDGDTIVEHVTVKPAFDGIVAYLVSWGVPAFRVGGNVPLPQPRVHLTTQTLHAGENVMTVPLAPPTYAGWQWEWGCSPGQALLTSDNIGAFTFINSGWGNFGGDLP